MATVERLAAAAVVTGNTLGDEVGVWVKVADWVCDECGVDVLDTLPEDVLPSQENEPTTPPFFANVSKESQFRPWFPCMCKSPPTCVRLGSKSL